MPRPSSSAKAGGTRSTKPGPGPSKRGRSSGSRLHNCCFKGGDSWDDLDKDDAASTHSKEPLAPGGADGGADVILGPTSPGPAEGEAEETAQWLVNGRVPKMEGGKYEEIRKKCLESNKLYEDPDFYADARSLYRGGYIFDIEWKRPGEISKNPRYIKDGLTYPDIHQGTVGNCWFIASVAALAASPQQAILFKVIPLDQGFSKDRYCGAFRFYFWRYGKWMEIIIDDKLPTLYGKLLYAINKSDPNEYWSPLLEKAYAKLLGDYHDLHGGRLNTAMVDLTGGMSEMIELKKNISDSQLRQMLLNCQAMNSFMGGAIFLSNFIRGSREQKKSNGLYEGHAYSIIKVKEIRKGNTSTTLLLVRNPWGRGEWNGAWSDKSAEWRTLSEEDRQSSFKTENDGEFWISLTDFRENFDELELCHLTPDALTKEIADNLDRSEWHITEHHGSWVPGLSAGGPPVSYTSKSFWSNPQFRIKLEGVNRPTTVIVSLFREKDFSARDDDVSIGFVIFQLKKGRKPKRITADNFYDYTPRLVQTSGPYWPYRERTVRYVMDPADHVIVPCTYEPGHEAKFYMRVFAEGDLITEPIEEERTDEGPGTAETPSGSATPKEPADIALDEAFADIAGTDGHIDAADLVGVVKAGLHAGGEKQHKGYNLETCRCLIGLSLPNSSRGLLSKASVEKIWTDLKIWRKAFRIVDKDMSKSVDIKELKYLFDVVDVHAGTETVVTVMKRYGGKDDKMSEEDFLQSFCKAMLSCRLFRELKAGKKVDMTLDEWLSTVLQI